MTPEQQLEAILKGKAWDAVQEHLDGNWSSASNVFTIPRSAFDAWADGIELPYGRVSKEKAACDGIYVLPDTEGWLVFEQQRGVHMPGERVYPDYKQAKRAALSLEYLGALRGAPWQPGPP